MCNTVDERICSVNGIAYKQKCNIAFTGTSTSINIANPSLQWGYGPGVLTASVWKQCAAACQGNANCKAFNIWQGYGSTNAICYMFSSTAYKVSDPLDYSKSTFAGIKREIYSACDTTICNDVDGRTCTVNGTPYKQLCNLVITGTATTTNIANGALRWGYGPGVLIAPVWEQCALQCKAAANCKLFNIWQGYGTSSAICSMYSSYSVFSPADPNDFSKSAFAGLLDS